MTPESTTQSRLPESYSPTQGGGNNYTRLKDGDTKIRILTSPIIGYEYFTVDNKPSRSKTMFKSTPDIKEWAKVKEFWAFVVYNYNEEAVQIMEVTQNTIKNQIFALSKDEDFGDPKLYDLKINRSGKDLETTYQVKALWQKPFENKQAIEEAKNINLEALFDGLDPFAPVTTTDEDVPF